MQIDIHTQHVELNATLRTFIQEKVGDLEHLIGSAGPAQARVEVGKPSAHHQSGPIYYAEINLTVGGRLLRGEAKNFDLHSAIVEARDELKAQIKRLKEK